MGWDAPHPPFCSAVVGDCGVPLEPFCGQAASDRPAKSLTAAPSPRSCFGHRCCRSGLTPCAHHRITRSPRHLHPGRALRAREVLDKRFHRRPNGSVLAAMGWVHGWQAVRPAFRGAVTSPHPQRLQPAQLQQPSPASAPSPPGKLSARSQGCSLFCSRNRCLTIGTSLVHNDFVGAEASTLRM